MLQKGLLKVLKKYHNHNRDIDKKLTTVALKHNHINILQWYNSMGFDIYIEKFATNYISKNGHVAVLNWFKKIRIRD